MSDPRALSLAEEIVSKQGVEPEDRADWIAAWAARLRVFEEEIRQECGECEHGYTGRTPCPACGAAKIVDLLLGKKS